MLEHELSRLMYDETGDPPPPQVDIARTMRDGRRRRRRRRLVPLAAAAAVVVVATGAFTYLGATTPPVQPYLVRPTATPTTSEPTAPESFDPLRLRLTVGWLPAGVERHDPVTATGSQEIAWSEPTSPEQNPQRGGDVTIYVAGREPWQIVTGLWTTEPADSVHGAEASWLIAPAQGFPTALAWRWAPNAWAVVRVRETDESTEPAIARQIAESVGTDGDEPVRLPFTATRPPAPLQLAVIEPASAQPEYSVELRFALDAVPMSSLESIGDTLVRLDVTWTPPGYQNKDTPNSTLDGSPAAVHFELDGSITLYRDGYEVFLSVPTAPLRQVVDEATAIEIATSVTPVGSPEDRTQWTADPLR